MKMVKFYCCTLSAFFLALMLFSCEKDDAEPSPFVSLEGSTLRVYVEDGRTLADSYGRGDGYNWLNVDSLIVEGFLHDDDFHTICEYGHGKKLSGLDLSNAIFEDKLFIPDYCFNRNWPNLSMIKLPQGTVGIGYCAFYGSPKLESVSMPNSVVELGSHAFGECFLLSTITLSDSIDDIKQYTFYKCEALARITIPASVKEIHSSSFIGCSNLKIVHLKSKTPPTVSDFPFLCSKEYEVNEDYVIIGGTPLKIILYVPAGCEEAYKNSSWAQNAIEIIGE